MNFNKKDSLATAVTDVLQQEALKGNQKKIDKNHNNKIDAGDFKILRGEKKVDEEIDVNDASEDSLGGQKKVKRKDDVGPSGDFKPSKVRFHAGPKNEEVEVKLADTKPESGVIKTEKSEPKDSDDPKAKEARKKLGMKEEAENLEEKNWIAGAIKKPGAMTAAAKREGKSTSEYIKSHEHEGGKAGHRARLAKTLKSFKEQYEENSIYDQMINEVLSKDASAGDWIHDFVHSDNPKFAGKSKEQRKKQALAAYYAKQRNEEVEQVEEAMGEKAAGNLDFVSKVKGAAKAAHKALTGGSDEDQLKNLQKKMGVPQTGKKPTSEEVEQIDEGGIGDLPNRGMTGSDTKGPFGVYHHDGGPGAGKLKIVSKHKTLDSALKHVNKLTKKSGKNDHFYGHLASHQPDQGKIPSQFHEEVEQIDEISKSTLGSYVKGAARDIGASRKLAADFQNAADKSRKPSAKAANTRLSDKFQATAQKRHTGIGKAVERLTKEDAEQVEEGWDDMLKSVKDRAKPQPSGGSGIKQGTRYGGSKQKDTPEHDEDKKKVTEAKRPETDNVPFVTNENKPLVVAKDLAKKSMKRMKTEMLGKISN